MRDSAGVDDMRGAFGSLMLAATLVAAPALAQSPTVRNATIAPGKQARMAVVTSLKNDCSVGTGGTITIVTPPKNGSLVVRSGKIKTPGTFRCPNVETQAQALFYQPKDKYSGSDEIAYETKSSDGATQSFNVKITVTGKPATGSKDVLDL